MGVEYTTLDSAVETDVMPAVLVSGEPLAGEDSGSEGDSDDQKIQYLCLTADNR